MAKKGKKKGLKKRTLYLYAALAIALVGLMAITGTIVFILANGGDDGGSGGGSGYKGESWDAWKTYTGDEDDNSLRIQDKSLFLNLSDDGVLEEMSELEGEQEFENAGEGGYYGEEYWDDDEEEEEEEPGLAVDEESKDDRDSSGAAEREIEEADIVKAVGNDMYVLNAYKGLIIVDLADPDDPSILGKAKVLGTPVEMYVVDFLVFIIVNTNYNYWYDYAEMKGDVAVSSQQNIGSQIKVVNVIDPQNPKVVKTFDLNGFSVDSRRVGEVIYVVTNTYSWWGYEGYMETQDMTYVSSISFSDPETVGVVEVIGFKGSSNNIHVSQEAIYVAQPMYDYRDYYDDDIDWEEEEETVTAEDDIEVDGVKVQIVEVDPPSDDVEDYEYWTRVTYVDIDDPYGDIDVRDNFDVPGYLENRYQMDYYERYFRIVTHFWPVNWEEQGTSHLYVYDVSNPDKAKKLSSLPIDDAGSLMATRFEGERAYTIHLPRSIDPLDVIDLSDPENPELCGVEHIEVRGMKLVTLGVEDADGPQQVAVSLFDVTDPYNAVLEDRVTIGDGYSWSGANWDDKRLSVCDDLNLVIVPYSSNDYSSGKYKTVHGVQIVSFDLEENDLTLNGVAETPLQVTRTRVVNDRIIATSDTHLISIDASDKNNPVVSAKLELAINVVDTHRVGNFLIEQVSNYGQELYFRVVSYNDPEIEEAMATYELEAYSGMTIFDGYYVYFIGYTYDYDEEYYRETYTLDVWDFTNPLEAEISGTYEFEEGVTPNIWGTSSYTGEKFTFLTKDKHIAVFSNNYDYTTSKQTYKLHLIDVSNPDDPDLASSTEVELNNYPSSVLYEASTVYITDMEYLGWNETNYGYDYKYWTTRVDISDPDEPTVKDAVNVPGILVGIDQSGKRAYSISQWWDDVDYYTVTTLNTLTFEGDTATIDAALKFDQNINKIVIKDQMAYITFGYSYYYGGYYEKDIAVDVEESWGDGRTRYNGGGTTTMMIVNLVDHDDPALFQTLNIPGSAALVKEDDGYLFFRYGGSEGILIYDINAPGMMRLLGFYVTGAYTQEMDVHDDSIYLLNGFYGIERIALPSGTLA
jgi:hypothetical protein